MPTVFFLQILRHDSLFSASAQLLCCVFPSKDQEAKHFSVMSPGVLSSDSQNITDRVDSSKNELI